MAFPETYANDGDATTAESRVNTVDVFIFNAVTDNLLNHASLTVADFNQQGNVYTTKTDIETSAGQRKVGIGINLPAAVVTEIITNQRKIDAVNDKTVYDVTAAMIATDNNFVMFSKNMPAVTVVPDETKSATDNKFKMDIERLAGKAALAKTDNFGVTPEIAALGNFFDVEYRLMQTNLKSYLMRDPLSKDPNYLTSDFIVDGSTPVGNQYDASVFENTAPSAFKAVEAINAYPDHSERPAFYGAENTADGYERGATTYFLVRALFFPTQYSNDQGNIITPTPFHNEGDDFWVVADKNVTHICDNEATAKDLAANAGVFSDPVTIIRHEGAYCYWPVWMGKVGAHDFRRNNYYVGRIKAITGFGFGNEEDVVKPPKEPIEVGSIECEFTILHWEFNLGDEAELH
jgi:hypothetical protein